MKREGSAAEVLRVFLVLGLTSFGGPVAHLSYFRREFVDRRGWITEADYAGLLALCQFLPGPASSQTGFCIGLRRAGALGGLAAWLGFTLPSAILMAIFAHFAGAFQSDRLARGALHGLELAAIAVVAQAVWTMARSLCPDTPRRLLAAFAVGLLLLVPNTAGQILVLLAGAVIGRMVLSPPQTVPATSTAETIAHLPAILCVATFALLLALAFLPAQNGSLALFAAFYRAGALVFGGGHVVLPLLRDAVVVPGWVSPPTFLSGYGAAQALPGPLFTVAAYLGSIANIGPGGIKGAAIATVAIFLPGLLLVAGALPYWRRLQSHPKLTATLQGVNAAVVGLLGAALLNLLTLGTIHHFWDFVITAAALLLLTWGRAKPIIVVALCAAAGVLV